LLPHQPSLFCQLYCSAVRQCRKPQQALPPHFRASRSMRRSRWRGHLRRSSGQTQGDLARDYQPDRQPLKRHRPSRIQYKGGLPSSRKLPAVATVVAKQASFKTGSAPWVGCSFGAGEAAGVGPYSLTCTDTLTYKTYLDCTSTKVFLSWTVREARWHCASLLAGGKLTQEKVTQLMQPAR
jgi:hypothetical protein